MRIREADVRDAESIAALLAELGYPQATAQVQQQLTALAGSTQDAVLVAATEPSAGIARLLGCISLHAMPMFHLQGKLGRITALVVAASARGHGIGSALLEAAHGWFESHGCIKFELTSGDHRDVAHRFYEAHRYVRESQRFVRKAATPI